MKTKLQKLWASIVAWFKGLFKKTTPVQATPVAPTPVEPPVAVPSDPVTPVQPTQPVTPTKPPEQPPVSGGVPSYPMGDTVTAFGNPVVQQVSVGVYNTFFVKAPKYPAQVVLVDVIGAPPSVTTYTTKMDGTVVVPTHTAIVSGGDGHVVSEDSQVFVKPSKSGYIGVQINPA